MRRFCSCGRTIWRGAHSRMAGAGVAQYWVRTFDPIWRHIDDRTPACDPPGDYANPEAGHLGAGLEQLAWLVITIIVIVVLLRLLGVV